MKHADGCPYLLNYDLLTYLLTYVLSDARIQTLIDSGGRGAKSLQR